MSGRKKLPISSVRIRRLKLSPARTTAILRVTLVSLSWRSSGPSAWLRRADMFLSFWIRSRELLERFKTHCRGGGGRWAGGLVGARGGVLRKFFWQRGKPKKTAP